jgi:peptidoglycan/LPS O-acetylase OafA/YrhL
MRDRAASLFLYIDCHFVAPLDAMTSPPVTPRERHLSYRPGIDGMRAIAVLGVVLYHAGFGPPAGFVGVDVFFVISGFLITSLLEMELAASDRIDLAAFYARRARRLLPALGLVLAVTVVACFFILSPYGELASALQSAAASIVFGANIFFQHTTGDYFGPDVNRSPLLHLWSLGVEEQYYLLWPLALLLARRLPLNGRRTVFALCALASLSFAEWALYRGSQAAFYAMPSRWWELSLGALVAWGPAPTTRIGRIESWAGFLLILEAMSTPTQHFPGFGATPALLGAVLMLHASSVEGGAWHILSSRPMVLIGRASYPFYLWHWPLLALAATTFSGDVLAPTRAMLVITAFALAVGTWRWVESPLHHIRIVAPRLILSGTLVICVLAAVVLAEVADVTHTLPLENDPAAVAARDVPANMGSCHASALTPPQLPEEAECSLGGHAPPQIAIWGDSHALAFQPFATALAVREGKTAIAYSRDACAPAAGYDNGKPPLEAARCREFNKIVLSRAETMDTVILASRWPRPSEREFASDLAATVDQLSLHVRRVFIIGATPFLRASVPDCLRRRALQECEENRDHFMARSTAVRELLSSFQAKYPNVTYVEPVDFFCDARVCPGTRHGIALYWDNDHIGSTAAAAFGKAYLTNKTDRDL